MRQQVNLLTVLPVRKKLIFSGMLLMLICTALILVFIVVGSLQSMSIRRVRKQVSALRTEVASLSVQRLAYLKANPEADNSKSLADRIKGIEAELGRVNQIKTKTAALLKQGKQSQSWLLEDLSKASVPGVWLKSFDFDAAHNSVKLDGAAKTSKLVRSIREKLNALPRFKARPFKVRFIREVTEKNGNTDMSFELQSGGRK